VRKIKIGHIITRLIIGGAQENTIFTAEGFKKKGYDVTLISGPPLGPEGSLIEETKKKGLKVLIIPELRREINPFLDTKAFIKLYFIIKKEKYSIIHTHSSKAGVLGRIAASVVSHKFLYIMLQSMTRHFHVGGRPPNGVPPAFLRKQEGGGLLTPKREGASPSPTLSALKYLFSPGKLFQLQHTKLVRRRIIIVHTIHGLPFHPHQNRVLNLIYVNLERFCSLFTDKIICVGKIMKEKAWAARLGNKKKFVVIHSGFEVEKYTNPQIEPEKERKRWGLDVNNIVIGNVGRLFPLKGQEYLLEILGEIKKVFPDVKLLLVGEGILRQTLEKKAENLGLKDAIIFTGLLPPEQIPKVISIFDLLVHTSLREGLPKTVAQGLAAGKPVVVFDVDGAKEIIINEKTGYLVPAKDTDNLRHTIIKALRNKEKSIIMAKEGQKLVKKLFPVEVMVNKIEEVYQELCGV